MEIKTKIKSLIDNCKRRIFFFCNIYKIYNELFLNQASCVKDLLTLHQFMIEQKNEIADLGRMIKNLDEYVVNGLNKSRKSAYDKIIRFEKKLGKQMDNVIDFSEKVERNIYEKVDNVLSSIPNKKNLDNLSEKFQHNYVRCMANLKNDVEDFKKEISEFKKNDNAVVRLSSLETRITLLEISHNGSGKTAPGTTRTDKD